MNPTDPPIEKKPLTCCSIAEILEALASDAMIPGCGTASGLALALATACAGKAVAITRRHDTGSTVLAELQTQLVSLTENALALAEDDARQFRHLLEENDPAAADALLRTDQTILDVCRRLDALLDDNAHRIARNMAGDWEAARALSQACQLIQKENVRELENDA